MENRSWCCLEGCDIMFFFIPCMQQNINNVLNYCTLPNKSHDNKGTQITLLTFYICERFLITSQSSAVIPSSCR